MSQFTAGWYVHWRTGTEHYVTPELAGLAICKLATARLEGPRNAWTPPPKLAAVQCRTCKRAYERYIRPLEASGDSK